MKRIYKYFAVILAMFFTISSCKEQQAIVEPQQRQPINISGIMTRSGGIPPTITYSNLGITARLNGADYLSNALATMSLPNGVISFNAGPWFYPINHSPLQLFAYTNPMSNDYLSLTSGQLVANDAILSNNGGSGTTSAPGAEATQIEFSHVMTKITVNVTTDDSELTGWTPSVFQFTMNGVYSTGQYSITSSAGAPATSLSGTYSIGLGVNYVVPTGQTLANNLTSLTIDNYVATAADLARYSISQISGASTTLTLSPGLAYQLTFNIRRLHLENISVQLVDWNRVSLSNDAVTDVPQTVNIAFGGYTAGDVTKIEVVDNSGNMYVGSVANSVASFLLAPTTAQRVRLYNNNGLLIQLDNAPVLSGGTLTLNNLNQYGMLPVNPMLAYDPVNNPYAISTIEQFKKIDATGNYSYRQMVNLDMQNAQTSSVNMVGSYDGNGFQIHGVNILGSGLFNSVAVGQTVKNVRISSGCVTQSGSNNYVGGICGQNNGTIVACVNEAMIVSSSIKHVGGICGDNNGQIIACMNGGNIQGVYGTGSYIGGICGYNSYLGSTAVLSAVSVGMITASGTFQSGNVGGICGYSVANAKFSTAYYLTGTAAPSIGGAEAAVNGTTLTLSDVADLSQQRMREAQTLINLNAVIPLPWTTVYNYILTSITWPMPVKII